MEFNYNVTGERRKALVTTISEVLDTKAWSSVKFSDKIFESILPWLRSPLM